MDKTMSLKGDIDTYSRNGDRYEGEVSPKGRKVRFLNRNGYDIEKKIANRYFKENDVLTVKEIFVGRSSSEVEFVEVPNERFNTVMFADVEESCDAWACSCHV
jgi:hypothetical protein